MNIAFFLLAAACAGWVFGIAAFMSAEGSGAAIAWAKMYYISPLVLGVASVIFAQVFPSGGAIRGIRVYLAVAGLVLLSTAIIAWDDFLFRELVYHPWGKEIVLNKPAYLLYSAYLLWTFWLTLKPIYQKTKAEKGLYRSQAVVFFDGYIISCVLGVFFNLILPWFGNYQLIWLGPLASNFYVVATAYGIMKHRLFDVRLVAARAVGYVLAIVALGSLYGMVTFVVMSQVMGGEHAPIRERIILAGLSVALAITFRPTKLFFDRLTNRLFFKDAYDLQTYMDSLNHTLVSSIDLGGLLSGTSEVVQRFLKTEGSVFLIVDAQDSPDQLSKFGTKHTDKQVIAAIRTATSHFPDEKVVILDRVEIKERKVQSLLQLNDVAVIGRIGSLDPSEESFLGYLVLGPKKSGYPYNNQDKKAMELTVNELVIAIQNAIRFQEIKLFNETLQERIENATKKLRHTNEKLRALDQTKDDFISMASHQLRTPLTSIKGYISMVLDGDAGSITSSQRKMLNQAFISSQRMVYLISDLLNVSRLKTGKFVIEPIPTNLSAVIAGEVEQLQETAKSRNLTLTYDKPAHFPTLMLDETKLRQVIMNFMDNAIYYTPQGGEIKVQLVEKPLSVEFTVTDNGIGVPKHEQHHLFSKFYRAHNAKRARPDGTGLGLFMAKKVIVAQGGAIIFKSHEKKGSTFGFTFAKERLMEQAQQAPAMQPAHHAVEYAEPQAATHSK